MTSPGTAIRPGALAPGAGALAAQGQPATWFDVVAATAARLPDQPAVQDGERSLTYAELLRQSQRLAGWLAGQGLRPGDRLGVHLRKGIEEVLATVAAVRLGVVFVHIHPQATVAQLRHIVQDAGIRVLITDGRRGAEVVADPALAGQLAVVSVGPGAAPLVPWPPLREDVEVPAIAVAPDDVAVLLYTSGSTGRPKGVIHTHRNLVAFAAALAASLEARESDRVLGLLPISFSYGLSQLLTTLAVGGTLVLQRSPFPGDVVKTLVDRRITGLGAVPSVWIQLLAYLDHQPTALPALRYVTNAGGHLPERHARRLRQHLPQTDIILMYGSTEALRSTVLPAALFEAKTGALGKPFAGSELFVVDAHGRLCAPGEPGELVQRGGLLSPGYWRNPEETARRFRPCPALGDEPVYHSGDLVRRDEDGVLWFVSRADWMVKSAGFRFSLQEVEELLLQSGFLAEAAAFAVDDEAAGQVVHAAVVPAAPGLALPALERHCWKVMPSAMIPRVFHPYDGPLPSLPNGKLDRVALRRQLEARGHERGGEATTTRAGDAC